MVATLRLRTPLRPKIVPLRHWARWHRRFLSMKSTGSVALSSMSTGLKLSRSKSAAGTPEFPAPHLFVSPGWRVRVLGRLHGPQGLAGGGRKEPRLAQDEEITQIRNKHKSGEAGPVIVLNVADAIEPSGITVNGHHQRGYERRGRRHAWHRERRPRQGEQEAPRRHRDEIWRRRVSDASPSADCENCSTTGTPGRGAAWTSRRRTWTADTGTSTKRCETAP